MRRKLRTDKEAIRKTLEAANWDFEAFPLYFTMEPWDADLDLLIKHREAIAAFRLFMRDVYAHDEDSEDKQFSWEETDFRGICVGFLIAKGVEHYDAHLLDTFLRYNLQYFDVDKAINPK